MFTCRFGTNILSISKLYNKRMHVYLYACFSFFGELVVKHLPGYWFASVGGSLRRTRGVVEMARADASALGPGTEPPGWQCRSASSAPLSPSEGASVSNGTLTRCSGLLGVPGEICTSVVPGCELSGSKNISWLANCRCSPLF